MSEKDTLEAEGARRRPFFIFAVGEQAFGVQPEHVLEVLSTCKPTRVPFTPPWVEGVISARGSVVPVFDISSYFGLEDTSESKRKRMVILGLSETSFAFGCERIIGVEDLDESRLEEPLSHLPQLLRECCHAQIKLDGQVVLLLDSRLLLEQSKERVKAS